MQKKESAPVIYIVTKLELGGAQKVCLSLFKNLSSYHHETWLISGTEGPLVAEVKNNPHVILLPSLHRECSMRTLTDDIKSFFALVSHLRKIKATHPNVIVHTHSTKAGYLGRWAAFFAGITRRFHTVHGFGFHAHQSKKSYFFAYLLEFFTACITTKYICVSSQDQKTGIKLLPRFSKKNSLIRAAIEDEQFYPAVPLQQPDNATFIFGTIGCFKKQKNLFDLLHAFKEVHHKHPHTRLEIIGDGILRNELETWIAQEQLADVITLHGWQKSVAPVMQRWHVFTMSSLWEGLPCAAVEARFLKLPILAYDVGGLHDIVIHGKNGFLYKPGQVHDLAQGMSTLVTDQLVLQQLKEYHEDLSNFTTSSMLLQHSLVYRYTRQ